MEKLAQIMKKKREVLTSGQAAKICRVATRTINKWCDSGAIQGVYRMPGAEDHRSRRKGRGDRRIPREGLKNFMVGAGMCEDWIQELEAHTEE